MNYKESVAVKIFDEFINWDLVDVINYEGKMTLVFNKGYETKGLQINNNKLFIVDMKKLEDTSK